MTKLKIYLGPRQETINATKFPIPFLENPNDEKSKLGDVLEIDEYGFGIIELNEDGAKYFSSRADQFSCTYIS